MEIQQLKPSINATKLSDTQLEVTKEVPQPVQVTTVYERDFIESQIVAITAQRDEMIALKEAELKECTDILAQMDLLKIVSKPIQTVEEPIQKEESILLK